MTATQPAPSSQAAPTHYPKPQLDIELMPVKLKALVPGMVIGYFKLLKRLRKSARDCNMVKTKWRVLCLGCKTEHTVPGNYMIRRPNPKLHCGCQDKEPSLRTKFNREYRIWYMMRMRTSDPRHKAYKDYGGRGIKVCPEWFDFETGFEKFLEYIGPAPSKAHSVDRKDNHKGYEPGNVRWATAIEQAQNTRAKQAERETRGETL